MSDGMHDIETEGWKKYDELDEECQDKPEGEKTNFAIHLVCAKRVLDITLKTKSMTQEEFDGMIYDILNRSYLGVPLERRVVMQSTEYFSDTFVITKQLMDDLDIFEYGVHEGFGE